MESVRKGAGKALSVALALLMVLFLLPIVPSGSVVLANADVSLSVLAYLNNHPTSDQQADLGFNVTRKDVTEDYFAKPSLSESSLKDAIQTDKSVIDPESISLGEITFRFEGLSGVSLEDEDPQGLATVSIDSTDPGSTTVVIEAQDTGSGKIKVESAWSASVAYSITVDDSTADPENLGESQEPTATTITGTLDLSVSDIAQYCESGALPYCELELEVANLYTDPEASADPSAGLTYGSSYEVEAPQNVQTGASATLVCGSAAPGSDQQAQLPLASNDSSFQLESTGAGYQLRACKVTDSLDSLDLYWKLDNGEIISQSLSFSVFACTIAPSGRSYDYRLEADQLPIIIQDIVSDVESQILEQDKSSVSVDEDASVLAFSAYPDENGGSLSLDANATVVLKNADGVANEDYSIDLSKVKASGAFSIKAVGSSGASDYQVVREGTDDVVADPSSEWSNSNLQVRRDGFTFSNDAQGGYSDRLLLQTAEGSYSNQSYYAKNEGTKVIVKVTDAAYNIDKTAPVVKAFSYSDAAAEYEGTLFFNEKADVTLAVSDDPNADAAQSSGYGYSGASVSGLSSEGASVSWHDDHADADHSVDKLSIQSASASSGTFTFAIDKEQEVRTSSIRATVKDNAGNVMDADTSAALCIPDDVMRLVADGAAPELSMSFDNNDVRHGCYYNANRTVTLTINEAHFELLQSYDSTQVIATIVENGQARYFNPGSFKKVGDDTWQATYTFSNNSDYSITAQVQDLLGRKSASFDDKFTIDKVNPEISVSFDNNSVVNGKYYSSARTATVTVTEHNFQAGLISVTPSSGAGNGSSATSAQMWDWSHDGDTHVMRVSFPGDGVYSLAVSGVDCADNAMTSYTCPEFVVDNTDPQISISIAGSSAGGVTVCGEDATVTVTIDDTNVDESQCMATLSSLGWSDSGNTVNSYSESRNVSTAQVTLSYGNPSASDPSNDGVYSLQVTVTDLAGRTVSSDTVQWSVNRFGSTYLPMGQTSQMVEKRYLKPSELSDIQIKEINPSGLQDSETMVMLTRGTDSAVLTEGVHYTVSAGSDGGWSTYDYTIGKENFSADSPYQLTIHSKDAANLVSENIMENKGVGHSEMPNLSFVVDGTAPICSFLDFDDSGDPSKDVRVSIEDNSFIGHVEAYLSDAGDVDRGSDSLDASALAKVSSSEIDSINEMLADGTQSKVELPITIPEANGRQVLTIVAEDKAGNSIPEYSREILVSSNPIVRWWANTPVKVATIGGTCAVAGVAAFFVGRRHGWLDQAFKGAR